jgi:hypothetical protein
MPFASVLSNLEYGMKDPFQALPIQFKESILFILPAILLYLLSSWFAKLAAWEVKDSN